MNPIRLFALTILAVVNLLLGNKCTAQSNDTTITKPLHSSIDLIRKKGGIFLNKVKDKGSRLMVRDSIKEGVAQKDVPIEQPLVVDDQVDSAIKNKSDTGCHIGWKDGRMAEFNNAYTLYRHEFKLNVAGRSSYGITDKLEVSSYLFLVILPNVSFKYRFVDRPHFAAAYEVGGAVGVIPVAVASGLLLPGGAFGGGTLGLLTGNDYYAKAFLSWKPSRKLTFSVRAGESRIRLSYHGIGALVMAGNSGGGAAVLPLNFRLLTTYYSMVGFEADYAINKRNGLDSKISYGEFSRTSGGILYPSLTYTHAMRKHFHFSLGIFKAMDTPHFDILKEKTNNPFPFDFYYNVYWIFNNGKRHARRA